MKYQGLTVAITGGTGFIGSHAVEFFKREGATVYILVRDMPNDNLTNNIVFGNVQIKEDVDYFIEKSQPDIFIHLAAQTQALYSIDYPYETIKNNVLGTLNVLESLKKYGKCRKILVASSDKSYGKLIGDSYSEDHPLNGVFPYDVSKSMTDMITKTYRDVYSMNIVTVKHCNVYGAGDFNFKRLIPGIMRAYAKDVPFVIRNYGKDLREYIYIDDVIRAYDYIFDYMEYGNERVFNLGSGDRLSSLDVFNIIKLKIKMLDPIFEGYFPGEIESQAMNYSLLNKETGWEPHCTAKHYMQKTAKWYINNIDNAN